MTIVTTKLQPESRHGFASRRIAVIRRATHSRSGPSGHCKGADAQSFLLSVCGSQRRQFFTADSRQHGAAALALMMMLGLAMGLLVLGYASGEQSSKFVDQQTSRALALARDALIGYAATYRDTHPDEAFGFLPCPDLGNGKEGVAASSCSSSVPGTIPGGPDITVIGRLPWRTLDLPPLRDSSGECLWYAVSGNYKNNPKTNDLLNRDSNGLIEVMAADGVQFIAGNTPTQRAVAVIFAPGEILPGQDRSLPLTNPPTICGGNYIAEYYLDTDAASSINNALIADPLAPPLNGMGITRFIAAPNSDLTPATNDSFNDRLVHIQSQDIFEDHIDRRVDAEINLTDPMIGLLRRSADCLLAYGLDNNGGQDHKYLPWAADLAMPPTFGFGRSDKYIDWSGQYSGRLPRTAWTSANGPNDNDAYKPGTLLLGDPPCPAWQLVDEFWEEWKDHLFYAVARGHSVPSSDGDDDDPCDSNECINVQDPDGIKTDMAAVVIFAGAKQTGQSRNNNSTAGQLYLSNEKNNPANYLEGINVTAIQTNPTSDSDPNRLFSKIAGNDSIMCLRTGPDPFSSDTVLYVDPACGAGGPASRCETDGGLLAAFRNNNGTPLDPTDDINNCRIGESGIDPACITIANRIDINNCPGSYPAPYSCERAARNFLSNRCLAGFANTDCQLAHDVLDNYCS